MFDEHADSSLVVSELRQFAKPAGWIHNLVACGATGTCVNNGRFIAKAGSRVLAMIIERIIALPSYEPGTGKTECIKATTGPYVLHGLVREYAQDPANRLVVREYDKLEPCISTSCEISERTYIVHAYELTWYNPAFLSFVRIYLRHHAAVNAAAILLMLMLLALISFLVYRVSMRQSPR